MPQLKHKKQSRLRKLPKFKHFYALIFILFFTAIGGYLLLSSRAAGNFVLTAVTNTLHCPSTAIRPQFAITGKYNYDGPTPEAPYRVEWKMTGDNGVQSISPSSGTIMGGANGDRAANQGSNTPNAFKYIDINITFKSSSGGTVTLTAVAYGNSGKVLGNLTTVKRYPNLQADHPSCGGTPPGGNTGTSSGGSGGQSPGQGDGGDGDGNGPKGTGTGQAPGKKPGNSPTPSPSTGGGGGGGSSATKQTEKPTPIPKTAPQGEKQEPTKIEPSPFYDGKEYKRGSATDILADTVNTTSKKVANTWPIALAVIILGGIAGFGYWKWRKNQ